MPAMRTVPLIVLWSVAVSEDVLQLKALERSFHTAAAINRTPRKSASGKTRNATGRGRKSKSVVAPSPEEDAGVPPEEEEDVGDQHDGAAPAPARPKKAGKARGDSPSLKELQEQCEKAGLSKSGNKAQLAERLGLGGAPAAYVAHAARVKAAGNAAKRRRLRDADSESEGESEDYGGSDGSGEEQPGECDSERAGDTNHGCGKTGALCVCCLVFHVC